MKPELLSLPEWSRPWAEHRLSQGSHDISGKQWNGLGDWLTALPTERPKMPAKLHKLTMTQALQASALWHENMARQAECIRADQAGFGGDPSAVEVLVDGGQGWRWVRVTSPEGLDYEGNVMGHCVGRGGYDMGKTIISLRDKHNMPHCTIEWHEKKRIVKQVQGRANGPVVEKYHESVVSFINALEPLAVRGADKFGHVFVEDKLVHWSKLPEGLTLETLDLANCTGLTHLPDKLNVKELYLSGCTRLTHLPDGLNVKELYLSDCTGLTHLPNEMSVRTLNLSDCTGLTHLPDSLNVKYLYLSGCTGLTHLPDKLNTKEMYMSVCIGLTHLPDVFAAEQINLENCTSLTHLPDGLNVKHLDVSCCTSLTHLPDRLSAECINLEGCTGLTHLPDDLTAKQMNLSGCTGMIKLPNKLNVKELDLMDCTGLTQLPYGLTAEYLELWGCTSLTHLPNGLTENCQVFGGDHLITIYNHRI